MAEVPVDTLALIDRPERVYDIAHARNTFMGKRVLITGAGGSIATEITRRVSFLNPAALILLNHGEEALYRAKEPDFQVGEVVPVLGDVRDAALLTDAFVKHRPDIVIHTAAVKHVPFAEDHPCEAALTNVIGTRNVVEACYAAGVGHLINVSTDKAVNATSVMGATKRAAELVLQHELTYRARECPRITIVRLGNVLGTSGSVVPAFQRQIAAGGPVTITHPAVTRYFLTLREAACGILCPATVPTDGEACVFVIDAGDPVPIVDLARRMLRARADEGYIPIKFTGLRKGEKMHEELLHSWEQPRHTSVEGITCAGMRWTDASGVDAKVTRLEDAALRGATGPVLTTLRSIVPEASI